MVASNALAMLVVWSVRQAWNSSKGSVSVVMEELKVKDSARSVRNCLETFANNQQLSCHLSLSKHNQQAHLNWK